MSDLLLLERVDHTAIITINRPERRNALGFGDDGVVFQRVVRELNADRNLRCVILTGCDGVFSAGGDLKELRDWAHDAGKKPRDFLKLYQAGIHEVVRALWNLEMPVVAAVNGAAIGLGNDLACLADIRIAAEKAKFGATFLKMGLAAAQDHRLGACLAALFRRPNHRFRNRRGLGSGLASRPRCEPAR